MSAGARGPGRAAGRGGGGPDAGDGAPARGSAPGGAAAALADSPLRRARDGELAKEGWTRRFIGGPPRLAEMTELYGELGQEVLLDPLRPGELDAECGECVLALSLFRVVYTRSER